MLYYAKAELHDNETFCNLIKNLSNYLLSPNLDDLVMKLTQERIELTVFEKLILENISSFFICCNGKNNAELFREVRNNMLSVLKKRIEKYSSSKAIVQAITYLTNTVFSSVKVLDRLYACDRAKSHELLDQLCETIHELNGGMSEDFRRVTCSIKVLLRILYFYTNHREFRKYIVNRGMRPILLKLIDSDEEETSNYSKQILAIISTDTELINDRREMSSAVIASMKLSIEDEEDIKCLKSSLKAIRGKISFSS